MLKNYVNHVSFLIKRWHSSVLYVTKNKAHDHFAYLVPHLDFDERIANKIDFVRNIVLRDLDIDLERIHHRWSFYKHLEAQKIVLETTKDHLNREIANLMHKEKKDEAAIESLKLSNKLLKEDLRNLKDYLYGVEENVALEILNLPNVLHPTTTNAEQIEHTHLKPPITRAKSHVAIGKEFNYLEMTASSCYLKNDAALFEFAITNYLNDRLKAAAFTQFSNADFVKSIVIEGCASDFRDSKSVFHLENPDGHTSDYLHLVGAASLYSFMSYFTKHVVQKALFPVQLFTVGRKYQPAKDDVSSLFNLAQETALDVFAATFDDQEAIDQEFERIIDETIKFYTSLEVPFRVVRAPAHSLKRYESVKVSFQVFSAHEQNFIEVGHLSQSDNYLSKRLLLNYTDESVRRYPKIVYGSLMRVQPLLGCILELNSLNNSELVMPLLKTYLL